MGQRADATVYVVQAPLRAVCVCLGAGRIVACCLGCLSLSGDFAINAAECLLSRFRRPGVLIRPGRPGTCRGPRGVSPR